MAINYTPVVESDYEELFGLRLIAMQESLERIGRFDIQRSRERFGNGFNPEHFTHVEYGGVRVGFFSYRKFEDHIRLDHLYVHPKFQKKGIGSAVLKKLFAMADGSGLPIRVGALRESRANEFYTRHGFQKTDEGEWDIYYLRPCTG